MVILKIGSSWGRNDQGLVQYIYTWSYKVIDSYKNNCEIVGISMSLLDWFQSKYVSDSHSHATKNIIECAAITLLYMSIKMNASNESFSTDSFFDLAGFTKDEVFGMERSILISLKWRENPPTIANGVFMTNSLLKKDQVLLHFLLFCVPFSL